MGWQEDFREAEKRIVKNHYTPAIRLEKRTKLRLHRFMSVIDIAAHACNLI